MLFRLAFSLAAALAASAAVDSIEVIERADVLGGKSFGKAGPYEKIVGKAHFKIDPSTAANRAITDIDLAPKNAEGLVEFAADVYILKPRDPSLGNGTALLEINNRGNKGIMGMFQFANSGLDPKSEAQFGDRFLLERGFTLVWVGWQFDVPDEPQLMRLYAPVAAGVTGIVRAEFIPNSRETSMSLGDRTHIPYAVADPNAASIKMTVRDRCEASRTEIPRASYQFARMEGGRLAPDLTRIYRQEGFEPGRVYEVVYPAKDPAIAGLGPAAVRDFLSYLKYGAAKAAINVLGDQRRFLKRAIGFGTSQSGRFLRTFLYYGFNRDEENRQVFDGVWAHVAGGGRGSFNHRFAQASRDGHPHLNCLYPTDIFPFTDNEQSDADTGLSGGILAKAMEDKVVPKIFYTNGSYEYWGRAAALTHSSIDGRSDAVLPETSRSYFLAGTQHGPGSFPPSGGAARNIANGNDYRWHMRALLDALTGWVADGKEPPQSQVPRVDKDQLATVGAVQWPKIPGSELPQRPQLAWRADYGPEFRTKGVVTQDPPVLGKPFAALVPQVDRDGNEVAGIRAPMLQAPLGTFTGWNLRRPEQGAKDEIYSMVGSTFLFARTKAERMKTGDPRPSIEERYPNKAAYLAKFQAAADSLAQAGYLLASDVPKLVEQGGRQWDAVMAPKR